MDAFHQRRHCGDHTARAAPGEEQAHAYQRSRHSSAFDTPLLHTVAGERWRAPGRALSLEGTVHQLPRSRRRSRWQTRPAGRSASGLNAAPADCLRGGGLQRKLTPGLIANFVVAAGRLMVCGENVLRSDQVVGRPPGGHERPEACRTDASKPSSSSAELKATFGSLGGRCAPLDLTWRSRPGLPALVLAVNGPAGWRAGEISPPPTT